MKNVGSVRTRFLLQLRELEFLAFNVNPSEVVKAALVRLFAAELIRKAGVKKFGKSPTYQHAKLGVRKAITLYLEGNANARKEFEKLNLCTQPG